MAQTNQKISRASLKKAVRRHNWALQWGWSYERMQASGFAYSMVPVFQELYDTDEEVCENLERHMMFYHSHPGTSAVLFGTTIALEEKYKKDIAASVKTAFMEPLAGIGNAIQLSLVESFACLTAAGLALSAWPGNLFSIPILIIPFILFFALRWPLFWLGYHKSAKVIENVHNPDKFSMFRNAAQIVGITVLGGLIPSMMSGLRLNISRIQEIGDINAGESINIQGLLNNIAPYLVPLGLLGFAYWMLKRRSLSPVKTVVILAVVAFVLGVFKVL